MKRPDLRAELAEARKATKLLHLKALERMGVPRTTLCNLWRRDLDYGIARVSAAGDGLYEPNEGELHLIVPIHEDGVLVDLCAFRSAAPGEWLLRTGQGWALGVECGLEPHTWGDPVGLAATPLDWLRQGTEGLCVVDWSAPEVRYLVGVPHIACATSELASVLRKALSSPPRFPKITVGESINVAA